MTTNTTAAIPVLKGLENEGFDWPCESPEVNLIEMLWHDLNRSGMLENPPKSEIKQTCKEELGKIHQGEKA